MRKNSMTKTSMKLRGGRILRKKRLEVEEFVEEEFGKDLVREEFEAVGSIANNLSSRMKSSAEV